MSRRMWAACVAAVAVVLPLAAARASAGQAPIAAKAPTGYHDYCGRQRGCPRGGVPQALWRTLRLPTLSAGAACSVASPHSVARGFAPVLGQGPVYFTAGAYNPADRSTMKTVPSDTGIAAGTGWAVAKAPLLVRTTFRQPLVVRGGRIDGPGELAFSGFGPQRPFAALQFAPGADGFHVGDYKAFGVDVWATAPGCYALQVDGPAFSRVIVFRVELTA